MPLNQSGLDVVARGQREHFGPLHGRLHPGDGLTHQQGLFVPVAAHELRRR